MVVGCYLFWSLKIIFLGALDNIERAAFIASKSFSSCFLAISSSMRPTDFSEDVLLAFSISLISVSSKVFVIYLILFNTFVIISLFD